MDSTGHVNDEEETNLPALDHLAIAQAPGVLYFTPLSPLLIFVSPEQTFARLRGDPRWFASLALAAAAAALSQSLFIYRMGTQQFLAAAVSSSQAIDKVGVVRSLASNANALMTGQAIASALGGVISTLLITSVVWLCATIVGEQLRFKSLFSTVAVVVCAYSITRAVMLMTTALFATHPESLNVKDPLATSVAYFAKPHSYEWVAFLGSLDVLSIGALLLLIQGIRVVFEISWRRASLAVGLPWLAYLGRGFLIALL